MGIFDNTKKETNIIMRLSIEQKERVKELADICCNGDMTKYIMELIKKDEIEKKNEILYYYKDKLQELLNEYNNQECGECKIENADLYWHDGEKWDKLDLYAMDELELKEEIKGIKNTFED